MIESLKDRRTPKICLITGANKGIGKATALGLAGLGHHVIMACRNLEHGNIAREEIVQRTHNPNIELLKVDLESFSSIQELTIQLKSRYDHLDVLINNAGTFQSALTFTHDKVEKQFGVNYLSPFFLTNDLIDLLSHSPSPRVVNLGSNMHRLGRIHFDDFFLSENYNGVISYSQSKLACILFTYELGRRFKKIGCTCYHPGAVNTDIGNANAGGIYKLGWTIVKPFFSSIERGAETGIYLATSQEVEGITAKYFYGKRIVRSSQQSYNVQLSERLWNDSEKLIRDYYST